ncbi:MAG: hypothetical protein KGN78_14290 [Actinomycetales bacterium]|nr:hypothetical protein [Actinomycetales bacterium]
MTTGRVAILLAAVVVAMAMPRIAGPSWRVIAMPNQMRLMEGRPVQWESETMFRTMKAMVTDLPNEALYPPTFGFSTDEYRAILPIFTASVIASVVGSLYWGSMLADLSWWWGGAVCTVALLGRLGVSRGVAVMAGMLTAVSPLGVAYVGSGNLHAASSLSLPIFATAIWDALFVAHPRPLLAGMRVGILLFAASLTYTYQWVLIPTFALVIAVQARTGARGLSLLAGVVVFGALTICARQALALIGLPINAHINDPLAVLLGGEGASGTPNSLANAVSAGLMAVNRWVQNAPSVFADTVWSYHPIMVAVAVVGCLHASRPVLAWVGAASLVAFAQGLIYSVPWVTMTAFPYLYGCAALGVHVQSTLLQKKLAMVYALGDVSPKRVRSIIAGAMMVVLTLSTNLDVIGIDWYVVKWWGFWYVPH